MKCLLLVLTLVAATAAQSYHDNDLQATTNCPCGWGSKGRIVGGKEAEANAYPAMAALTLADKVPFCGATILTTQHAVTAAHCTNDIKNKVSEMRLLVGAHDFRRAANEQFIPIRMTVEHQAYNPDDNEANDIAILVLARSLIFRQDVGPICLPPRRVNLENRYIRVLGWGLTKHEGQLSRVLREVDLRVIPYATCLRSYPRELQKTRSQFCTFEKNKDSCQGDSGGPLLAIDPEINRLVLVGLVSYGMDCASDSPAVNTDLGYYLDWIKSVINQTSTGLQTCAKVKTPF